MLEGHAGASRQASWGGVWQGRGLWMAFVLAKGGASPTQQTTDSAFHRACSRRSWEAAGHTQGSEAGAAAVAPARGLHAGEPRSAWGLPPLPGARLERDRFLLWGLKAGRAMKSGTSAESTRVHRCHPGSPPPAVGAGSHHGAVHVHAFAAPRGRHGVLGHARAVLLLPQGFPARGGQRQRSGPGARPPATYRALLGSAPLHRWAGGWAGALRRLLVPSCLGCLGRRPAPALGLSGCSFPI